MSSRANDIREPATLGPASEVILEAREVTRIFRPPGEPAVPVLDRLSLVLRRGESVAVLGPSGCGKSTLLNLVGGLDRPDEGTILLHGRDLAAAGDRELAARRNREIGFVFQLHHLLPQCTVLENVLVPTLPRTDHPDRAALHRRATELLARVGLQDRARAYPGTLSGGERQRVAVARAVINQPRLLLADEPTGALDAAAAQALTQLLVELNRDEQTTLLVVTHAHDLARRLDRALRLRQGRLEPLSVEAP